MEPIENDRRARKEIEDRGIASKDDEHGISLVQGTRFFTTAFVPPCVGTCSSMRCWVRSFGCSMRKAVCPFAQSFLAPVLRFVCVADMLQATKLFQRFLRDTADAAHVVRLLHPSTHSVTNKSVSTSLALLFFLKQKSRVGRKKCM